MVVSLETQMAKVVATRQSRHLDDCIKMAAIVDLCVVQVNPFVLGNTLIHNTIAKMCCKYNHLNVQFVLKHPDVVQSALSVKR